MKQFISGVADFMGYPGMTTLICPQDPSEPARLGYHASKYVSIWDNGNRESVTVDSHLVTILLAFDSNIEFHFQINFNFVVEANHSTQ